MPAPLIVYPGWFTGLSSKFLSARTARLLVLAGAERLDKELMIGQMQGKFQLVVLAGVGHLLHEVAILCGNMADGVADFELGRPFAIGRNPSGILATKRARRCRRQEGWRVVRSI